MGQYLAGSSAIWIIKPVLGLLKIRVLQFSASLMINIVVAKIFVKCQLPLNTILQLCWFLTITFDGFILP